MITDVFIYCLEFSVILAVFFLFYILILKKETHFQLNRMYLLGSVVLSFVIPLVNISLSDQKFNTAKSFQSFISFLQGYKNIYHSGNFTFQRSEKTDKAKGEEHSRINKPLSSKNSASYSAQSLLFLFYCTISMVLLCKVLFRIYSIMALVFKNPRIKTDGITYVHLNKSISPFSFLRFIFLPRDIYSNQNYSMMLTHEKIHIRQLHSIDILVMEAVSILFWFNPVTWIYKHLLRDLHEYLADSSVLQSGYNKNEYKAQLLQQALVNNSLICSNFVPNNLTKRVGMITKNKSSSHSKFKLLLVMPIIIIMICMFSMSYSKVNYHKTRGILNELGLSLTVSDFIVEFCAIGGCLPSITYIRFTDEYCLTDEDDKVKYGYFSDNDKVLFNNKREIVTEIAVGDTVYEGYFHDEKSYRNSTDKKTFLDNLPIVVTSDFTCIRKPFSLSTVIDNMLFVICQRFGGADDITSIALHIDDSVSYELRKKIKHIIIKNGFRNITIQ